jgi:hypothetical protein
MSLILMKDVFPVIKTTPGGYWIDISKVGYIKGQINHRGKKWVSNEKLSLARKFAYETEELAKINFLARKYKQIRLLKIQLSQAKAEQELVERMINDEKINLPFRLNRRFKHGMVI